MPKPQPQPHWPADGDYAFVARFLLILREDRLKQGLSIREVAQRADIDHGIIARGEKMARIPSIVTMRKWVRALGLDWHQVYREAETGQSP